MRMEVGTKALFGGGWAWARMDPRAGGDVGQLATGEACFQGSGPCALACGPVVSAGCWARERVEGGFSESFGVPL